jgi:hypothetical protein
MAVTDLSADPTVTHSEPSDVDDRHQSFQLAVPMTSTAPARPALTTASMTSAKVFQTNSIGQGGKDAQERVGSGQGAALGRSRSTAHRR